MTSEVAVMNKEAIALAADSAVTFTDGTGQKIFTSASKIFTLSKYQPVGIMFYGNASFMGVPWETVIKVYGSRLGTDSFKTVRGYAEDFLAFLRTGDALSSDEEQNEFLDRSISWCFWRIKEKIDNQVNRILYEGGEIEESALETLTTQIIQLEFNEWQEAEATPLAPTSLTDEFSELYSELVGRAKSAIFEELPLKKEASEQLRGIAFNLLFKLPKGMYIPESSGVVIAGFGTDDVFPALESYTIEGRIGEYLKHRRNEGDCRRIGGSLRAAVLPFAQREMVDTFMAGIDPDIQLLIERFVKHLPISFSQMREGDIAELTHDPDVSDEDLYYYDDMDRFLDEFWTEIRGAIGYVLESELDQFLDSLSEHSDRRHLNPIISVVQGLPKDELAAMAESLISLTSFKRRVSMQAETVGGPIDVAVISKGDGFIWIKRKQYFEDEINSQFSADRYR